MNKVMRYKAVMSAAILVMSVSAGHSQSALEEQRAGLSLDLDRLTAVKSSGLDDLAEKYGLRTSDLESYIPAITPEPGLADALQLQAPKWYGKDSRQANMTFTTFMLYKIHGNYKGPVSRILEDSAQRGEILELVNRQVQHMYGAFTTHPEFADSPGIPSKDYKLTLLGAEEVPGQGYAKISYSYEDTVVFAKSLFGGAGPARISFVLPKDPVTIYSKGLEKDFWRISPKNLCTDEHYNSEGDFWYFWNPRKSGCPLTDEDLVTVQSDLRMMEVTRDTYPEYDRLYGDNGGGDVLRVTYLVGVDESFEKGDAGQRNFEDSFGKLRANGFEVTADEPRHKRLSLPAAGKRTVIDMYLVDAGSGEFVERAVQGMKSSDIFLYDGHSGLGGYLNPERLWPGAGRGSALPKDKYQIFFFHGCSTYAYYNNDFFKLKRSSSDPKGTKNLDILTTGIGAAFSTGAKVDVTFLTAVATGQRPSWQAILDRITAAEGWNTALTHINGDEDNPRTP